MSRLPQAVQDVATALQDVLMDVADTAAVQSGWCQRQRKLSGSVLVQALTLGYLAKPQATRAQLAQAAACAGVVISPQGLAQRLDEKAATLFQQVLEAAVAQVLCAPLVPVPLLCRFTSVEVRDSTIITLPAALAEKWPGCGEGQAALKAQVRLDLCRGRLEGPLLGAGRTHDARAGRAHTPLEAGALHLADLGYFDLADLGYFDLAYFAELMAHGAYYLSRVKANTLLYDTCDAQAGGQPLSHWLHQAERRAERRAERCARQCAKGGNSANGAGCGMVELQLQMGAERLPCRVLAVRVPPAVAAQRRVRLKAEARHKQQPVSAERLALAEWTVLVTNAPAELLSVREALVLYRARWQIERLFRLWKEVGAVDQWCGNQAWAILCEVYAKLLGCVVQHWLLLSGAWEDAARSWHKAAQLVQNHAYALLGCLAHEKSLHTTLQTIRRGMSRACRLEKRSKAPATFQLLLACSAEP